MAQESPVAGVLAFFRCSHSFGLFAPPLHCDELEQDSLYKPHDLVTFYVDFDVSTAGLLLSRHQSMRSTIYTSKTQMIRSEWAGSFLTAEVSHFDRCCFCFGLKDSNGPLISINNVRFKRVKDA